ncbi:nitroreductase [Brevibacterium sp. 50QC2O2]|jgi:nitroreductase|uniref:nitroreductase n=1 Tax=Brevibacterium sp. 50QC2O2 TaxID=2968459 RepID=UPI00211BB3C4|nr:nitroreductase [Brevibacterium sp. 50QC2O2]MCQ9387204.1 nitroreductase [Brevibacterium sp. 50QC2O2]
MTAMEHSTLNPLPRTAADDTGDDTAQDAVRDHAAQVLDRLLTERFSCRAFLPEPVPHETISQIIASASHAPSWCNTQPWHLHVLEGTAAGELRGAVSTAARQRLAKGLPETPDIPFPTSFEGVYRERRRASGWQLYDAVGVRKGDREASGREMLKNFDFFAAPTVAILTTTATLGTYGVLDCGLFLQSFLLAAQARGVAGVPQAAPAGYSDVIRRELGLDDDRLVVCAVALGFPDSEAPVNGYRTARQGLDELVTWVG